MFNVCPGCGDYSAEKTIDSSGPFAICKRCGHRHSFIRLPLLIVTGASGTGKTTVALELAPTMPECVCMESDILWTDEFNKPDDDYSQFKAESVDTVVALLFEATIGFHHPAFVAISVGENREPLLRKLLDTLINGLRV